VIAVKVIGAETVIAKWSAVSSPLRARLAETTLQLAIEAQRRVMETKLTGQVLHVKTGRLRRSINVQAISESDTVGASTGTNVIYGRFWELGFQGTEQVRAHTRAVKALDVREWANGRRRKVGSGIAFVRAHTRKVNSAPRPFLVPVLTEMREKAKAEMTAAVTGAF
jgi:phage gpG-like protein